MEKEKTKTFTINLEEHDCFNEKINEEIFILTFNSFWEGFGIDILTAYALHVPVIAANVGSLPEVVGDGGILVDPNSTNSIANAIEKILNMNKGEYDRLVLKQKEQLKKFSWEDTAKKTLETIRKAADNK